MSQLPKPLFVPGDIVRYITPNGDKCLLAIGKVHHPKSADDWYRYSGVGFRELPEASLALSGPPIPQPQFQVGDAVMFAGGYCGPVAGRIIRVHPATEHQPEYLYDFFTEGSGHDRLVELRAPKHPGNCFTFISRPSPVPVHTLEITDDMVDRYLAKAAEYGAMDTMPPLRDRVVGLLRAAMGQP